MKNNWIFFIICVVIFGALYFGFCWHAWNYSYTNVNYVIKEVPQELQSLLWQKDSPYDFEIINIHLSDLPDKSYIITFFIKWSDMEQIDNYLLSLNIEFQRLEK